MTAYVCLLRGVNVGGNRMVSMPALKSAYEALGLENVKTYVQSGNVVFSTSIKRDQLISKLEAALHKLAGTEVQVVLRTAAEMRKVIAANPMKAREEEPGRLLVTFLSEPLSKEATATVMKAAVAGGEEVCVLGREIYVYYPNGAGRSKLAASMTEKKLGAVPTARNWNSVLALAKMAEESGKANEE